MYFLEYLKIVGYNYFHRWEIYLNIITLNNILDINRRFFLFLLNSYIIFIV